MEFTQKPEPKFDAAPSKPADADPELFAQPGPDAAPDSAAPQEVRTAEVLAQLAQIVARTAEERTAPASATLQTSASAGLSATADEPIAVPTINAGPRLDAPVRPVTPRAASLDVAPVPVSEEIVAAARAPRRSLVGLAIRLTLLVGVAAAGTIGWLSHDEAAKQMIARWSNPLAAAPQALAEPVAAEPPAPTNARASTGEPAEPTFQAASAPPVAPPAALPPQVQQQIESMAREIASLRQTVARLSSGHEQMGQTVEKLQASDAKQQAADAKHKAAERAERKTADRQATERAAQEARRRAAAAVLPTTMPPPRGAGAPERPLGTLPASAAPASRMSAEALPPPPAGSDLPPPPRRPPAGLPMQLQ